MKYKQEILALGTTLGTFFVLLSLSSFSSVSAKAVEPRFNNDEYNDFFQNLTTSEKSWIMYLAVLYFDADKIVVSPFPIPSNNHINAFPFGTKPVPTNDTEGELPETLISHFLNGDVPKYWQKEFTKWLSKTYKLTSKNFEKYRSTGEFCSREDACELIDLANVGGICCPFG